MAHSGLATLRTAISRSLKRNFNPAAGVHDRERRIPRFRRRGATATRHRGHAADFWQPDGPGTVGEQALPIMCQACDMDTPVRDDTGRQSIDFNSTSQNDPSRGKLAKFAREKTR